MRQYELSDHLGNVLAAVLDRKVGSSGCHNATYAISYPNPANSSVMLAGTTTGLVYNYWMADVVSAQDYYPFGMMMPGRIYSSGIGLAARVGYNGQRRDDEIAGIGNSLDLGARQHDTRLARLNWSVDPLAAKFPSQSPYSFAGNNPIIYVDEEGKKKTLYINMIDERTGGATQVKIVTPGLIARENFKPDGAFSDWHATVSSWDWYDSEQTLTLNINKSGKTTAAFSDVTLGDYRTNTLLKYESYAASKIGEPFDFDEGKVKDDRRFGGWIGTSKYGGGSDNKFEPKAGDGSVYVDMGSILGAFSGTGALGKPYSIGLGSLKAALLEQGQGSNPLGFLQKMGIIGTQKHGDQVECPSCHSQSDSEHVDLVNGQGTYDSIINSPPPQTGGKR